MKSVQTTTVLSLFCVLIGLGGDVRAQDAECVEDTCGAADHFRVICISPVEMLDAGGNPLMETFRGLGLCSANLQAATILTRMDVDGDGVPDLARDTDGDGLPDNWELGGNETQDRDGDNRPDDRVVFFPAPTAIVPGTPPTPLFNRRAVATSALSADTDGDGLSDFIEVFGLMFIDENRDGRLDDIEWADLNGDGLPSPGEFPRSNIGAAAPIVAPDRRPVALLHDFDGFVFTDPTNPDTDGDGLLDGEDPDPLINPRSFGLSSNVLIRFDIDDDDIDNDGLGNAMDMGNDLVPEDGPGVRRFQNLDNPQDVPRILDLFRRDLLSEGIVPESVIEDLLGVDWNGNGLWRTTDVREWTPVIADPAVAGSVPPDEFVLDDGSKLYAPREFSDLKTIYDGTNSESFGRQCIGNQCLGLGWQLVLKPPSRDEFIPDVHIWPILYAWRVPGFDIDGDGFIGVPNIPSTAAGAGNNAVVALRRRSASSPFELVDNVSRSSDSANDRPMDDRITIAPETPTASNELDGVIDAPGVTNFFRTLGCGAFGMITLAAMFAGLIGLRRTRR